MIARINAGGRVSPRQMREAINEVSEILNQLKGIGCRIAKSGNRWTIVVDPGIPPDGGDGGGGGSPPTIDLGTSDKTLKAKVNGSLTGTGVTFDLTHDSSYGTVHVEMGGNKVGSGVGIDLGLDAINNRLKAKVGGATVGSGVPIVFVTSA